MKIYIKRCKKCAVLLSVYLSEIYKNIYIKKVIQTRECSASIKGSFLSNNKYSVGKISDLIWILITKYECIKNIHHK